MQLSNIPEHAPLNSSPENDWFGEELQEILQTAETKLNKILSEFENGTRRVCHRICDHFELRFFHNRCM